MYVLKLCTFPSRVMAEVTRNRNGHTRSVKCSHIGIFSVVNRQYLVSQTIQGSVLSQRFLAKPNTAQHNAWPFHKKIQKCPRINLSCFSRCEFGTPLLKLLNCKQQPQETSPQHPGVVRLHVNAFYFSTTARRVTPPTWGSPPPCKQALRKKINNSSEKHSTVNSVVIINTFSMWSESKLDQWSKSI